MLTKIASRCALAIAVRAASGTKISCRARHHGVQSRALQDFLQTQRRIERHHFFRHSLVRNSSPIKAAMTRIDDDR